MAEKGNKIEKYRRPINLNIGMIMFAVPAGTEISTPL